jgi:hypothetical protein
VGGALGNGAGGALIDISAGAQLAWLPWIGMCGVAILSAVGFLVLHRDARFRGRLASTRTREPTTTISIGSGGTELRRQKTTA